MHGESISEDWQWLHMVELWDYLSEGAQSSEDNSSGEGAQEA